MFVTRFDAARPGAVFVKVTPEDEEEECNLFGDDTGPLPAMAPVAIPPPRLDLARQTYLYCHIHQFVKENSQDTLCPCPAEETVPEPSGQQETAPPAGPSSDHEHQCRGRGRGRRVREASSSPPRCQRHASKDVAAREKTLEWDTLPLF